MRRTTGRVIAIAATLTTWACGPTTESPEADCGEGSRAEIDAQEYCVYRQELIIEGFSCPDGMQLHELPDFDLTVCGGSQGFEMPPEHVEDIGERYGTPEVENNPTNNPVQCAAVPTCDAGEDEVDLTACAAAGGACAEEEECGASIGCLTVPETCDTSVGTPAACPNSVYWEEVSECDPGVGCEVRWGSGDQCSSYVFCAPTAAPLGALEGTAKDGCSPVDAPLVTIQVTPNPGEIMCAQDASSDFYLAALDIGSVDDITLNTTYGMAGDGTGNPQQATRCDGDGCNPVGFMRVTFTEQMGGVYEGTYDLLDEGGRVTESGSLTIEVCGGPDVVCG
jgi:hypothetical protein